MPSICWRSAHGNSEQNQLGVFERKWEMRRMGLHHVAFFTVSSPNTTRIWLSSTQSHSLFSIFKCKQQIPLCPAGQSLPTYLCPLVFLEELQTWAEKIVAQMLGQHNYYPSFIAVHEFALACNDAVRHSLYYIVVRYKRIENQCSHPFRAATPLAFATSVRWDSAVWRAGSAEKKRRRSGNPNSVGSKSLQGEKIKWQMARIAMEAHRSAWRDLGVPAGCRD